MDVKTPNPPTFTADFSGRSHADRDTEFAAKEVSPLLKLVTEIQVLRVTAEDTLVVKYDPDDPSAVDLSQDLAFALRKSVGVRGVVFLPKGFDLEVVRKV